MSESIRIGGDYRGRYQVRRQIATGGTSCVYLVHDRWLSREAVLKKGLTGGRYTRDALRAIFANEDYILGRLQGKFVPARYEFLPDDLELYIEHRPGQTLDEYIVQWTSANGFPADQLLLRLVRTILEAVQSCHRSDVVVADLKPRNIQIGPGQAEGDFSVTLLDFGSAWVSSRCGHGRDVDYTAGYGAPELLRGEVPTTASDMYSLGAILFALLGHREPTLDVPPRDFAGRRSLVLPAVQDLVLRLTDESPSHRPAPEEVFRTLRGCEEDVADLARVSRAYCPKCQQPVADAAARFCRHCGAPLTRGTVVLSEELEPSERVDPVTRLVECERAGEDIHALFWAKHAVKANLLPPRERVLALEVALRIPGEMDFASELAASISLDSLPGAPERRKYLVCLGRFLQGKGQPLGPHRALFEEGVAAWPDEECLWCWLHLASDRSQQEQVLRSALVYHPESARIHYYLGRSLHQQGQRAEALATWVEAVQKGEREPSFLRAVYQLARELGDERRAEVLREVILGGQPQDTEGCLALARFAAKEGRTARALEVVEQSLSREPYNRDLRRCKAEILFDQRKYEMVLDLEWVKSPGDDAILKGLKGRCCYELGRHAEAAQEMAAVITKGEGTAETWFYLVRCYQRLGMLDREQKALTQAVRAFPDDERLRRLVETRS